MVGIMAKIKGSEKRKVRHHKILCRIHHTGKGTGPNSRPTVTRIFLRKGFLLWFVFFVFLSSSSSPSSIAIDRSMIRGVISRKELRCPCHTGTPFFFFLLTRQDPSFFWATLIAIEISNENQKGVGRFFLGFFFLFAALVFLRDEQEGSLAKKRATRGALIIRRRTLRRTSRGTSGCSMFHFRTTPRSFQ